MSTNASGTRKPSVQPNEHSWFALELAAYLNHLRGDMAGREFARRATAGTHDHWSRILAGKKIMTTNDVKVAAEVFGLNPYDFVRDARTFAARGNVVPFPSVGAPSDDAYEQLPTRDQRLPERKVAKRGTLKSRQEEAEGNEGATEDGGSGGA